MKPILLVLAAGIGSRFGGIKQLEKVGKNGETLLDYSCYDAVKSGFGKIVFIIRPDIEKDFRDCLFNRISGSTDAVYVFQTLNSFMNDEQIFLSRERKKPWGTVQAVLCAEKYLDRPFAIINADDYYGPESFRILSNYLSETDNDSSNYAMAGYLLKNTMSLKGTVSRGVCQVNGQMLTGLSEHKEIGYRGQSIISHFNGEDVELTGNEVVSMNMFGLTPHVLRYMKSSLQSFWKEKISDAKAEYILADFLSDMIKEKKCTLKVFSSPEKWFGMTYIEDKETVKKSLAEKTERGFYPESLWCRL